MLDLYKELVVLKRRMGLLERAVYDLQVERANLNEAVLDRDRTLILKNDTIRKLEEDVKTLRYFAERNVGED